jgi:hypothetical protein
LWWKSFAGRGDFNVLTRPYVGILAHVGENRADGEKGPKGGTGKITIEFSTEKCVTVLS